MRTFKDSEGREWPIALNIGAAKRVKDALGVDLLDPGCLRTLAADPYTVANVLYVACEAKAKERSLSDEQFGEALRGDVIDQATDALLDELVDFFPKRQREALTALLATIRKGQQEGAALAQEKILSPAMDQAIQRAKTQASIEIDKLLSGIGNASGNVPEASA